MASGGSQTTVGLTVAANMDVSGILNGVKSMQGAFNGLKLPANLTGDALKQFDKLKESLTKYRELMEKGVSTKTDLKQLEKLEKTIKGSFSELSKVYDELSGKKIYLEADATAIKNAQKDIDQLKQDVQNKLSSIKFEFSSPTKGKVDIGLNELVSDMERAVKSSKTVSASMREMTNSVKGGNFTEAAKGLTQIEQQASKLKGASVGLLKTFQQMGLIQFSKSAEDLYKSGQHVALLHQGFEKLRGALSADDAELKQFIKSLEDATTKKNELEKIGEQNYKNSFSVEKQNLDNIKQGYDQCAEAARGFSQQTLSAAQQVEQLQQSTQYFFSLRNMINLLKRGIDEAVQSVKDLDKAMTETAVVTDYKVSDLWGMLPEYTKVANQLGATTQGAYETMTLYYQQGLDQQQAFELGAETMKMARIAGLDYAETTDMMTAALRGFNMELNETSAKRVNDVYSELAAITASDTEELGTAMQRTASIAASAGASFEGTTAFLAQAIETTREPAENIGTAMKTIVARFQEMKKNPLEISEVDGEEVDYNKIDAALKSIGVDLKDTNGQFREFDQVMLDISAKWDTLSQSQQRYIATTAAGSRQQSRFIAMVSNYDRTMQLMEAANNSAGASDEQFGKTMDSLESKLNQLHNAWQAFTMGIANNSMIKTAVDGLTTFLTVTNNIIDKLSMGSGAIKSFLSVFAAFTGLKAAGRIANRAIGGLGGLIDPQSTFKEGFKGGAIKQGQTGTTQAKAISDPIVTAVNRIYGAITGKQATTNQTAQNTSADFKTFKNANAEMRNFLGNIKANEKFSIAEAYGKIGNLDIRQQKAVLQQLPGLQLSLQKNGINFSTAGLSNDTSKLIKTFNKEINQGLKDKAIDSQGILQLFGTPDNFKKGMEARGPEYIKAAEEVLNKGIDRAKIQDEALNSKIVERDLLGAKWSDDQILEMAQKEADKKIKTLQEGNLKESIKGTASAGMEAANNIASIGQAAVMAGQGIAQLGMQLSNAGFEKAGQAITNLGYQISSLGQIATSVGSLVGKISGAGGIGALVTAHPVITALAAAMAVLGGAIAIAATHFKKIKDAGEEVVKTFKDTSKSTEDNIAKLKSYRSELAILSKGVDSNGNNVNLDDSQYQRYLEIVDDIAAINPNIVEGYNAQGHAIINNNTALAETLKLQEQIKDKTYETYTSEASLQKLINARNINKDYKNIQTQENGVSMGYGHGSEGRNASNGIGKAVPLAGDVSSIADKLRLVTGTDALGNTIKVDDKMLQKYGIESMDALISGEEQAVKKFIKHRDQIQADLANSGIELNEGILKGFEKLGEDSAAFDAAIQPVYDNLLANVSNSKVFESIAPEFRDALNMGLKDLASQDLSGSEMIKAANNMATRFANLTTGSGKYQDALETVEEAQQEFANTLNETEYRANVEPAIQDLTKLKEEALDEGTAYGDALAEYLENQIQRISNFTQEGGANLTEALNTATDEIAAAEGALDSFNEATKRDYSTAAEGMKSIFDKTTETFKDSYGTEIQKHAEGMGDATFWTGAEALLSGKELERLTKGKDGYEAAEAVAKKIKGLEPMLREGQEGFDAFTDRVLENADAMDKLAEAGVTYDKESGLITNIPDDQWHNVAEALGISDDLLTSMLNKGRQFADISFMNVEDARKALATSDYTIKGTQAAPGEQQNLYVKEDTLRRELSDAGYVRREQQDEQIAKLLDKGVKTIPADATQLTKDELNNMAGDWGINTLPDLIQTLNDTGDFTKDEIKNYADQMGLLGSDTQYDELYSDIIEAAENPELVKQTGVLETISAQIAAMAVSDDASQGKTQKELDKTNEEMLGGKGVDTDAQAFAYGKKLVKDENGNIIRDKNGNAKLERLTAGEYEETKKSMQAVADSYRETAAIAAAKAKVATGEDKKYWEGVQKNAEEGATRADKYMQMADKAMQKQEDLNKKEAEGNAKEKAARDDARKKEQDAKKAAADKAKEEAEKKGQNQTNYEAGKLKTESEGRAARDEGRAKEAQQQRQKEIEEANKQRWEAENKRAQAVAAAEKQAAEDKLKTQKTLQEQGEIEGQKLKQKYEAEEQARKRQNIEEQSRLEGEKLAERARLEQEAQRKTQLASQDQGRSQGRALSSEQTAVQAEDIQGKTDYLLRTSINTSLKTALDNLDPTQIASDPAQSQAFSNLYADLINNRLPKAEDLQALGIFNQLDSQYQNQITGGIGEKISALGEELGTIYQTFSQTNKTAAAIDIASNDTIGKAITTIGQRLKSWRDKINNINAESSVNAPKVTSAVTSGVSAVSQVAQNALKDVQSKITVDTSEGEAKVADLKTLVDTTVSTINQGASFKINVNNNGLKDVAKQAESIAKTSGNKSVSVTASGASDTGKLSAAVKDFNKLSNKTISLSVKTSGLSGVQSLTNAVKSFHRLSSKTITLTTIKETINRATGAHNHGYAAAPLFNSAASGYGQLGPKGKGGLTLTGELGYEIAWLPSENRSMILGAKGPQMVNLPSDAVVWTHEQSKKILKQKSIPAGSHANELASTYKKKYIITPSISSTSSSNKNNKSGGGSSGSSGESSGSNSSNSSAKENHFSIEEVIRFDYERTLETLATKIKRTTDEIEKNLDKIGTTASDISENIQTQTKNLEATVKYNEKLAASYQKDLNALDTSQYMMTVSYDAGGSKKESKEYTFDLQKYIYRNSDTGAYQIDVNAIKKLGNKALEEAVTKAAEDALNPLVSGLSKAQDAMYEAQKQITELNKKLVETFYMWKNEITEVYTLTQRINAETAKTDRLSSQVSLELTKLNTGFGDTAESIAIMIKANKRNNDSLVKQVQLQNDLIKAEEQELIKLTTAEEETNRIEMFRRMEVGPGKGQFSTQAEKDEAIRQAEEERDLAVLMMNYIDVNKKEDGTIDYDIRWEKLEQDRLNDPITAKSYEELKKRLDLIGERNTKINEDIQKGTELTNSLFEQLKHYQELMADYEGTILNQLNEQMQKEIDSAEKLGNTISESLKDLLSEVKRKLDERRKQEDNAKTEKDISQKQQRLAALRADTSGGHQVEIAQLQKEIADSQQSYQRTLEDQLIDKLQQQGDEAAQQRERQIEIAQAHLEVDKEKNKEQVAEWLRNPTQFKDELQSLYLESQDYTSKGLLAQQQIKNESESKFAELVVAAIESELGEEQLAKTGYTTTNDVDFHNQVVDLLNNLQNIFGDRSTLLESITDRNINEAGYITKIDRMVNGIEAEGLTGLKRRLISEETLERWANSGLIWKDEALISGADFDLIEKVYGRHGGERPQSAEAKKNTEIAIKLQSNAPIGNIDNIILKMGQAYKTGGLANYTGLAWLDGTPSKPELVLNAKDTQNFLALRDVLSKAIGSTNTTANSYGGDIMYDIDIHVDKIEKDYDVDRVVDKVKKEITKGAGYRNVTQVRNFR